MMRKMRVSVFLCAATESESCVESKNEKKEGVMLVLESQKLRDFD